MDQWDGRPASRIVVPDSLGRTLLEMVARAPGGSGGLSRVPVLGRRGKLDGSLRRQMLAEDGRAEAMDHELAGLIDAEAVAGWFTGHYVDAEYPAVVLGSPHGATAHLAAALGAAWLPTGFAVDLTWPGGSAADWPGALAWGQTLAGQVQAANPGISTRQVHDPVRRGPLAGATVRLHVCWRTLPRAYQEFLTDRLAPGGGSLLVRDLRTWPAVPVSAGHSFQLGSPVSGWQPGDYDISNPWFWQTLHDLGDTAWPVPGGLAPAGYAERAGEPALEAELVRLAAETGRTGHRVLYSSPAALSGCVADLFRQWLRDVGHGGEECVVECGRLLDPWRALAGGLVPYWCEAASSAEVEAAELWLAGSEPFTAVTALPEPPGYDNDAVASLSHWRSLPAFGLRRVPLDRLAAGRYPRLPVAASHAARLLTDASGPRRATPPAMALPYVLSFLEQPGILVS